MNKSHLLKYLLTSPNLPVGGFCYSEGLESFFISKNIKEPKFVEALHSRGYQSYSSLKVIIYDKKC